MKLNYQSLKDLIQGEIREHLDSKFRREQGMYPDLEPYINYSKISKEFYNNFNIEELSNLYMKQINDIADSCKNLSTKRKVLYLLELMRLSVMYENIGEKGAVLSQAGINSAITGKGVCTSQAKYFRNLLLGCNIESQTLRLHISYEVPEHETVITKISPNETTILDPTYYNGNPSSIPQFVNEEKYAYSNLSEFNISALNVTEEELENVRKMAREFILRYYGINKILEVIDFDKSSEIDLFSHIIIILQNNLVISRIDEKYRSVVFGNREFEIDKALELLLYYYKIPFKIIYNGLKHECYYNITISSKDYIVSPQNIFKRNSNLINRKWLVRLEGENFNINEDCQKIYSRLDELNSIANNKDKPDQNDSSIGLVSKK